MKARILRKSFGLIAMAALVFAQLMVAAHACDDLIPSCHRIGDTAITCAAHCADAASNVDHSAPADIGPPDAPPLRIVWHADTRSQILPGKSDAALMHPGSPPIEIRYCRLRN